MSGSGLGATATPPTQFVAYYRGSTDRQGKSGLGLQAQRDAVAKYVAGTGGIVAAEFEEIESGKRNDRPQLSAALAACRVRRAALVIAKLDRLARNARFLLHVVEGTGEAGVVFCELPSVPPGPVGTFLLTQMAAVAEVEAGLISQRTRAALATEGAGDPARQPAAACRNAGAGVRGRGGEEQPSPRQGGGCRTLHGGGTSGRRLPVGRVGGGADQPRRAHPGRQDLLASGAGKTGVGSVSQR